MPKIFHSKKYFQFSKSNSANKKQQEEIATNATKAKFGQTKPLDICGWVYRKIKVEATTMIKLNKVPRLVISAKIFSGNIPDKTDTMQAVIIILI